MIALRTQSWPALIIAISILVSVAWSLRLAFLPDELILVTDHARTLLAGRNILYGQLPLVGPRTSVGALSLGPLYYYCTAVALWLSRFDPFGPVLMTITSSTLMVVGMFWWLKRHTPVSTALLSALFLAVSPLIIQQSRLAIEPTPLPLLVVLWLFATERWLRAPSRWAVVVLIVLLLATIQLNMSAILLGGANIFLALGRQSQPRRTNTTRLLAIAVGLFVVGKYLLRPLATSPLYLAREWSLLTTPAQPALAGFLLFCAGIGIYRLTRRRTLLWSRLFLTLLLVCLVGFLTKRVASDHALALLFPLAGPLIALGLEPLHRRLPFAVVVPLLAATMLFLALQAVPLLRAEVPYTWQHHLQVARRIIQKTDGEPYTLIYRGHLDIYDSADDHYQYALWYLGHPPVRSFLQEEGKLPETWLLDRATTPTDRTVILTNPANSPGNEHIE